MNNLEATRAFVEAIFGAEVAGWDAFVSNVFEHADRSHHSAVRGRSVNGASSRVQP